ncbi:YfcC family protein [Lentiprolixibacter aurantiacus]|uniref:YfcC family protein n=1 Tax=Lentiprolixibacter aurantiacus TaxID=2993939 RepID=A0AAE3SN63_9FLAO|nr:Na+/H+ antiporter NhaC family protein [Lentiprolixibacter aurantiacus]MCX2718097.1 YfcC family protein [Lentiprolixibacter aurantiacus]
MKKLPNAFTLMLGIIFLTWGATFIIPKGSYSRLTDPDSGRTTVVNGSYKQIEAESLDILDLILAAPEGMVSRADLIVLIFLLGGCFFIIEKTGAMGQGLQWVVDRLKGRDWVALVLVSIVFATGGATIGMQEEFIALTPLLIAFSRSLGYNAFVAIGMSFGAGVVGAAFSPMNPFSVVLAQQEAELPLLSGMEFRLVFLLVALVAYVFFLWRYARANTIEKQPMTDTDEKMSARNGLILFLVAVTFSIVTYGLLLMDWGFNEISACFFVLGILTGLLARLGIGRTGMLYVEGMKEMTYAVVILGLASSIPLLLEKGQIMDTVIHAAFTPMENLPPGMSALGMMGSQALLHFPIMSYSAQALMTMPVLIPLSDLVGVSRQVCVLSYQYGAVNMDMLVPTNGALMAIIAVAGISYDKWVKFVWKPLFLCFVIAIIAVITGVYIGI